MKNWLRKLVFHLTRRLFAADEGRTLLADALPGRQPAGANFQPDPHLLAELPYPESSTASPPASGEGAVFITSRFRSGSTLVWNLFRHLPGCTAYYEPLNERQWFNPARRGQQVDRTHKHVEEYWQEYEGLSELGQHYREDWIGRDLFLPADAWDPDLRRYIEILIERAAGRAVLQFNRVDFRLPWLRTNFPQAKIVHLYRHPRDQWLSTMFGGPHVPLRCGLAEFAAFDQFYLRLWGSDLKHAFPFLDERRLDHPYELFYLIWKLSYLFGRQYADVSLAFEQLLQDSREELERLFEALHISTPVNQSLLDLIERPKLGRWTEYADDEWFRDHEVTCERTLADYFAATGKRLVAEVH